MLRRRYVGRGVNASSNAVVAANHLLSPLSGFAHCDFRVFEDDIAQEKDRNDDTVGTTSVSIA